MRRALEDLIWWKSERASVFFLVPKRCACCDQILAALICKLFNSWRSCCPAQQNAHAVKDWSAGSLWAADTVTQSAGCRLASITALRSLPDSQELTLSCWSLQYLTIPPLFCVKSRSFTSPGLRTVGHGSTHLSNPNEGFLLMVEMYVLKPEKKRRKANFELFWIQIKELLSLLGS